MLEMPIPLVSDMAAIVARLQADELREAIASSRNDPRLPIDADAVFSELEAIIDCVASEQRCM